MRLVIVALCLLALPLTLLAQPWRYVDSKGQVHYTSNVDELPPKMRQRILDQWGDAGVPPPPPPRPEPVRPRPARPVAPVVEEAVPAREAAPTAAAAAEALLEAKLAVANLKVELQSAQATLEQARRQALLVPSGIAYAQRAEAEERVARLEAALKAAEAKVSALSR